MSIVNDTKSKMNQAVEHLKMEYKSLRTNRVNPNMLDDVKVEAYGSMMPLKGLGSISVQERQLIIMLFDQSISQAVVKAINQSGLNLNAILESGHIRVPVPPLNEELRKGVAKQAKEKLEKAKNAVRDIRRKANDEVKKDKSSGKVTEDEMKRIEKEIQKLTDDHCTVLDKLCVDKEKEILTI